MTIGDVLAWVAGVLGVSVANWALLVGTALVFEKRAALAQQRIEEDSLRVFGTGVILVVTAGVLALVLVNQPNGALKLVGWMLLMGLLALCALGGGGLALLLGSRIRHLDSGLSSLSALARGAGLIVLAALVPVLGWFFLVPLAIIISLGAAFQVMWPRRRPPSPNPAQSTFTRPPSAPMEAAS
jgi:hypothetical protein